MIRLIYRSVARTEFTPHDLGEITAQARVRNGGEGISGMLLYHDRQILQILEGKADMVDACFNRLKYDPRHHKVSIICRKPAKTPGFTKWYLGCADLSSLPLTARLDALTFAQIEARLGAVAQIEDVREGKQAMVDTLSEFLGGMSYA